MTGQEILWEIRRRIGDISGILDAIDLEYTDEYLMEFVKSAINFNDALGLLDSTYTVSEIDLSPEPSSIDGMILSTYATKLVLSGDIATNVRSGGLGIRFRSGQDEISTVEASRRVNELASDSEKDYRNMVMAKIAGSTTGAERKQ